VHEQLVEVAQAEERYARARAALAGLRPPPALGEAQRERQRLDVELRELDGRLQAVSLRIEDLEVQRHEVLERRARLERQAESADYRDQQRLEQERSMLLSRLEELDEAELEVLEEQDQLQARRAELEAERALVGARELALAEELEAERARRSEELRVAEAAWLSALNPLEAPLREQLRARAARGRALALLVGGRCSACHTELSSSVAAAVGKGDQIECESCGAWLLVGELPRSGA